MTTAADGFLLLLKAEPTLMPPAPQDYDSVERIRRLRHSIACLRCGRPARTATVTETELGPRWLDLCSGCLLWVRTESTPAWMTEGL